MEAPGEAVLLDCCFGNERVCFSAASDGSINRFLILIVVFPRYDLDLGIKVPVGNHEDLATCIEYSAETCQIITAGWGEKIKFWDARSTLSHECLNSLVSEVESMSLSGLNLMVAAGSSVTIYDIRSFKTSVHTQGMKVKCVRPIFNPKGFVVGSIDGRVILEYICKSSSNEGIIGSFVTDGYATLWDARGRKWIFEMSRYPNSVVSLSYSHDGLLLAVASSYSYQEANEIEEPHQIFIHEMGNCDLTSAFFWRCKEKITANTQSDYGC
ncbi:unnamed protein product [Withania somnifera]